MDALRLASLLSELPVERTRLLDNLGRVRREVGPLTPELSDALADHMSIRRGEVHEVASFYSFLSVPVDAVRVCTGPVCDCLGARALLAGTREHAPPGATRRGAVPRPLRPRAGGDPRRRDPPCGRSEVGHAQDERRRLARARAGRRDAGGLRAARRARAVLRAPLDRESVVAELKASGLAGYGGAGFPTGVKWEAVARRARPAHRGRERRRGRARDDQGPLRDGAAAAPAARGDADRDALRGGGRGLHLPARGVRGVARAARRALAELRAAGLLEGVSIELVIGAGAYICGEETAMLESMEGRRGMPRLKPPFPSQVGYLGRPTLINNVETLAHIPAILRERRRALAARPALVGVRRGARARLLRGAARRHARELIDEYAGGATAELGAIVPGGAASGSSRRPRSTSRSPGRRCASGAPGPARPACRSSPRATRCSACSPRRCASSPRSRARSARPAGSATGRCTTCVERLEHGEAAMPRGRSRSGSTRWSRRRSAASARPRRSRMRNAFRLWPELFAPLDRIE